MEIRIIGNAKEIAALVVAVQERQSVTWGDIKTLKKREFVPESAQGVSKGGVKQKCC